jgi:TolA-binding protein
MVILMFKPLKTLVFLLFCLSSSLVSSQSIDGLQEIVKLQQDKISIIEDNLKKLIGSIEEQSNKNNSNNNSKFIVNQINEINQKLILLENNIKNITNLAYNLDFALKRIERHLELSSIQEKDNSKNISNLNTKNEYKVANKPEIKQESLNAKTEGVLGYINEPNNKQVKATENFIKNENNKIENDPVLPKGTAEENFNYALDFASQLDFENAEKAFKEFLTKYKESNKVADAQYWLGRVYFAQKKFEEAAIALAEFNSVFPNDPRFQETTLLIAESAVNFAPKDQLCDILNQSLEFMVNPSEKFVKRINILKNEKQCTTG